MPVKSAKQWRLMGAARSGKLRSAGGPSPAVAKEFMDATPESKRKKFANAFTRKKSNKDHQMHGLLRQMS